ncbi:sensor histidine kinase [Egbenema bharatensis]|uniref:sensor histidine kinase n=1 Tax=Egbenema bharatensis TaxID=3463334 RepID=UPI003A88FFE4
MNLDNLDRLRDCCRDESAFERMKQILMDTPSVPVSTQGSEGDQQKALLQVITHIRASLDLDSLFQTTATEVRQLLNADRVGMFRFDPDSEWDDGEFVSEDVLPGFHSALNTRVHDHCFGEQYAIHYQAGQIQAVADIYHAGLRDCHIDILRQFQIRANLVVPLRPEGRLWGLLCIHQCSNPREWQPDEIQFVAQIADHLAVAIQQAELLAQTQRQAVMLSQMLEDLKRSRTQLIQSEKMSSLGQLVAGIAHEINNPVNFIYGNLSHANQYAQNLLEALTLFQQEHASPSPELAERIAELDLDFLIEDFPKILSSMQLGADRIQQIVLSLRTFSRLDETSMNLTNIHEGLDSTLLILQYRFKPRSNTAGIQIIKEYGELPLVECYASQLNQVFMNILTNAIDALEEAAERGDRPDDTNEWLPQITIRTGIIPDSETNSSRIIIRIADNALGIPEAIQSKLFEPFFTTKPAGKGTGLGLSISQQIIVDRHSGSLECYSQPGEGTEFWIELPMQSQPSIPEQATSTEESPSIPRLGYIEA